MKIKDRNKLADWFTVLMEALAAEPSAHFRDGYRIATPIGTMHLKLDVGSDARDGQSLFCRLDDISLALPALGGSMNPHSGKYNFHPGCAHTLEALQDAFLYHISRAVPNVRELAARHPAAA